jgi:hypothetical protein
MPLRDVAAKREDLRLPRRDEMYSSGTWADFVSRSDTIPYQGNADVLESMGDTRLAA